MFSKRTPKLAEAAAAEPESVTFSRSGAQVVTHSFGCTVWRHHRGQHRHRHQRGAIAKLGLRRLSYISEASVCRDERTCGNSAQQSCAAATVLGSV